LATSSRWVRASKSGIVDCRLTLGARVTKGEQMGVLRDPFGKQLGRLKAPSDGVLVGKLLHPLVNRGDAVLNVAATE